MADRKQGRGSVLGYAGIAGALFLASGCDAFADPDAQYAAICVNEQTQERLDDDACGDYDDEGHSSGVGAYFLWMPLSAGNAYIPPVGQRMPPNSPAVRTVPAGTPIAKGVPKSGGQVSAVQRGGFGIKAGSTGGTGAKAGTAGGKSGGS
ncbi:hypothetical protein [Amycolatopsis lurida]|uniref:hypothetical protein n=1 Tax=Amycolatopsis lurida TaxID=31959 RepID=UPI00365A8950